jgi:hypothetical protein
MSKYTTGGTVRLTDGSKVEGESVTLKDNGWVFVRTKRGKRYYPPHAVEKVVVNE